MTIKFPIGDYYSDAPARNYINNGGYAHGV